MAEQQGDDATIFDCPHQDAVQWNPFAHAVQCHQCGLIFAPWDYTTPLPESITPRLDIHADSDLDGGAG